MDNVVIKIKDRVIPLRFRMNQFIQAEEEIGNIGEIEEMIQTGKERGKNLVKLIRIMGNAGLKAAGEPDDLTDEWLMEEMIPGHLKAYQMAVLVCMTIETNVQTKKEDENGERDLVLEEINKKKDPTNTHTETSSDSD